MDPQLFTHNIFKRVAALFVMVSMLSFGAPACVFSEAFPPVASAMFTAFAEDEADETAALQERHISFEYGYTECTGEVHPVSDSGVGIGDNTDTAYPEYYTVTMMLCDTGHVIRAAGDGVTVDNVTYESLDQAVLEVDSDGNVTLKKGGTARIRATAAADETYDECSKLLYVKVDRHEGWIDSVLFRYADRPAAWGLDLDTSDGPHQLVFPIRPGAKVRYLSENPSIVSVDQNGIFTPLSAGMVQVWFDVDDGGGKYKACRFERTIKITGETVTPPALLERHVWFEYGYTDCTGEEHHCAADSVSPSGSYDTQYPTYYTVTMDMCDTGHVLRAKSDSISDDEITVTSQTYDLLKLDSDGKVTLEKEGNAHIIAIVPADETYKECIVHLWVTIDRHTGLIEDAPIYYEGRPQDTGLDLDTADGPQKLVVPLRPGASAACSTDNSDVAYVNDDGVVTPVAPGKTTLTITTDDGGGIYKEGYKVIEINVTGEDISGGNAEEQAAAEAAAREAAAREAAARAAAKKAAQAAALKAEIAKAKSLKKPTFKVKSLKKRRNKLTWGKVQNADGYIVYVKYPGKKKYVKAATRKANVKSVTHKGLTKGRVYRYKVRAYKVVNGKYYYGPFSKARKARVK